MFSNNGTATTRVYCTWRKVRPVETEPFPFASTYRASAYSNSRTTSPSWKANSSPIGWSTNSPHIMEHTGSQHPNTRTYPEPDQSSDPTSFTYLLCHSRSRDLLEKLTGSQLVKTFPAFYGTRKFITAFTRARHVPILNKINPVHVPLSHFLKTYLNIILSSTSGSSKWSPSIRFPHQNPLCSSPLSHTCYMPDPSYSSQFDHPNNIW